MEFNRYCRSSNLILGSMTSHRTSILILYSCGSLLKKHLT